MIVEVKMYTVVCDSCGKDAGADSEYCCWNNEHIAEQQACEDGKWRNEDDKHYCPDCWHFDDEGELIIHDKPAPEGQ